MSVSGDEWGKSPMHDHVTRVNLMNAFNVFFSSTVTGKLKAQNTVTEPANHVTTAKQRKTMNCYITNNKDKHKH